MRAIFDANYVKIDLSDFVLRGGEKKLKSWIDYHASSKSLEIRICIFGEAKPSVPRTANTIDLWGNCGSHETVYMGLSSLNSKPSSQFCRVDSWTSRPRNGAEWIHSQPVDPRAISDGQIRPLNRVHKRGRGVCPTTLFGGVILAMVCGALMAFGLLLLWGIFVRRDTTAVLFPVEYHQVHPVGFRYEKVSVIVENDLPRAVEE